MVVWLLLYYVELNTCAEKSKRNIPDHQIIFGLSRKLSLAYMVSDQSIIFQDSAFGAEFLARLCLQPALKMGTDERIVMKICRGGVDSVDFFYLSR